ncbi:putative ribonuclease H-like domain-containing protein, partial [Tanacetum coccineum]
LTEYDCSLTISSGLCSLFRSRVRACLVKGVNTAGQTAVSVVKGNGVTAVKATAGCVWRPKMTDLNNVSKDNSGSWENPQQAFKNKGIFDSGCSKHMTGNKDFLTDYQDIDGGFVAFGGGSRGGKIIGKGKIRTNKIDFEDVFFVKELNFNLFSVSQMCDKKNNVLFTETECLILSSDFKLLDENQVLLRVPRQSNMYSFDLRNVIPSGDLTCLFANATINESKLWHRRMGHVNFKTMNKLVKGNLVRGFPSKIFVNNHTCVACQKGKQHKASCKTKLVSSINQPLQMLHMDLFGPTSVRSINHKTYCLVVTDDFSRFSWVFFSASKDETSGIHKRFIIEIENQLNHKVKVIRCDNGTKFKNREMNEFYGLKGIKREFSIARTPQQNGVAERKNRTLIEAAKTLLADSLLPTVFWVEAVLCKFDRKDEEGFLVGYSVNNKAFRVFNSQNRKVEENLHVNFLENKLNVAGQGPNWLFDIDSLTNSMNYQPVTTGNQTNKNAGPQETNGNTGLKKNVDAGQSEEKNVSTQQYIMFPLWSSISLSNKSSDEADEDDTADDAAGETPVQKPASENEQALKNVLDKMMDQEKEAKEQSDAVRKEFEAQCNRQYLSGKSTRASSTNSFNTVSTPVNTAGGSRIFGDAGSSFVPLSKFTNLPHDPLMLDLEDTAEVPNTGIFCSAYDDDDLDTCNSPYADQVVGVEADFNNMESFTVVSPIPTTRVHSIHPKDQIIGDSSWVEAMQEKLLQFKIQKVWTLVDLPYGKKAIDTKWGIDYDEVFAPVARIEAIRLFLAYASFMNFLVYQMDVKSAFLYGTIEEEVYVSQPPGFVDPEFPEKVYKVEKALYCLHQAPRAWYETLSTYLLDNGFYRGQIDKTLFIKRVKDDIILVQVYVDDIIFGSTKKYLCIDFEQIMHKRFQMSSMGELTFFLGLQVKQKEDGIFINQDKYVGEILKKFGFSSIRIANTPMETNKALTKDEDGEDVDVHLYRSMIGSLMYLTSSRPDIMFSVCACSRFQVQPKVSHLNAVKRIFRYLKGRPNLGLWYPKDSPFILEAFSDSDYAGASLDRKSTTGGCQFLGSRLISWQCKKQTVVANSTTEAEYIAASHCCGQVLWIQNQMLDYGYNFMQTKIHVDNESAICVVKNPVYHSKTKHIEIRHHFIRDSYEKRLIEMVKIHTDYNVSDLFTKAFNVTRFQFLIASIGLELQDKKELAIPRQTTTGKEFSNPLMAGSLPKTITCLEKSDENAEFHQIVDFLSTCSINYALTVSPTIYASYIEQFWNTATSKIINSVKQIHAIVDGKAVVISESSVRSDLLFNDEDGVTCLTNDEIFENLALMGYEQLSTKLTFQKAYIEQLFPSLTTYQRKRKTQKHRRTKKDTELPQTSVPLDHGADEAVPQDSDNIFKTQSTTMLNVDIPQGIDTGGSPKRQETIGGTPAQTRSERVLEQPNEPPISEGYTSGSGEGRMEQTFELMDNVLDLEKEKDAQAVEILNLKKRVKKLERKKKSSISHPRRRKYRQVETSSSNGLDEEDASKQGRRSDKIKPMFTDKDFEELDDHKENIEEETVNAATTGVSTAAVTISTAEPRTPPSSTTIFDDENVTMAMARTLIKMKEHKAKEKGVAITDVEDSSSTVRPIRSITTLQPLPNIDTKDKGKGVLVKEEPVKIKKKDQGDLQIQADAELAQRLHEEELAELERRQKERVAQEEASMDALYKEYDTIQVSIDADALFAAKLQQEEREQFTIKERA